MDKKDRCIGSLLGLAIGDAIGTTLEFRTRDAFRPLTDMIGGGPFNLEAGQYTDDTSMALCIADSLIETQSYDPEDQLKRYVRWYKKGYMSSTGICFDIGNQTRTALREFSTTGNVYRSNLSSNESGNGSLMRLAPIPIAFSDNIELAGKLSADSSITTHPSLECREACSSYGKLIVHAINGASKDTIFSEAQKIASTLKAPKLINVLNGSFRTKTREQIKSTGYVVDSLEAALWAFANSNTFAEGVLLAANLGDDADTVAAIYGQFAGAFYGQNGIPDKWQKRLFNNLMIKDFGSKLFEKIGSYTIKQTHPVIE